jgi:hypothetical protein
MGAAQSVKKLVKSGRIRVFRSRKKRRHTVSFVFVIVNVSNIPGFPNHRRLHCIRHAAHHKISELSITNA